MEQMTGRGKMRWLVLISASVALMIAGCATTRSYTPEIDRMRVDLAEAKAAGAQTLAPDEYARAESCLDWWTHYVTQFDHIGDATMANLPARCRTALQALKSKMAVAPVAMVPDMPAPPPPPAPPAPEVDRGIYPKEGTLRDTMAPPPAPAPPPPMAAREAEKKPPLGDIFFDYDQSLIRPDAKQTLEKNIAWLRANTKPNLMIEGHCDERGTQEYNLALGQRRAKVAQDYLVASGIDEKRIKTISYGKERPFVVGHDESAWQWNRRAHFLLP
jgi:peptidoglycan-associated lipoprotein